MTLWMIIVHCIYIMKIVSDCNIIFLLLVTEQNMEASPEKKSDHVSVFLYEFL
jgi:hypothetical protein